MKAKPAVLFQLGLFLLVPALFMASPPRLHSQDPAVKNGVIKEKQKYKSGRGLFSITVPAAGNPFVRTYKMRESQLKDDSFDFEDVLFRIVDFGQAYGAGVRRIPQAVLTQMAKEDEKQALSDLADKALFQWRDDYAVPPRFVDDSSIDTQFGRGLLRVYLAKGSSLLGKRVGSTAAGKPKTEHFDAYVAVLVVKKGAWFIYATAEDDYMQQQKSRLPQPPAENADSAFDPKPLEKEVQAFFASMTVNSQM